LSNDELAGLQANGTCWLLPMCLHAATNICLNTGHRYTASNAKMLMALALQGAERFERNSDSACYWMSTKDKRLLLLATFQPSGHGANALHSMKLLSCVCTLHLSL